MTATDTICAPATPAGTGAIAVIRISGTEAIAICNKIFRGKNLQQAKSHTVHYGHITDGEKLVDEVMVAVFRAPRSFTTEDVVEISCHGSAFITEQILQLLLRHGARAARPGEFTMRAFMNGRIDLTQAEAVADLISSDSVASHAIALKQMRGGFAAELKSLRQQLIDYTALIELELDFGEEDVEFANRQKLLDLIDHVQSTIRPLIESFRIGNVIKHGVNTVIAGKPNAGKSTLLNALLNEERAIVSDIPGTTRDSIEEVIVINGLRFRFTDTAGLRQSTDVIEQAGVQRSYQKIQEAAVLIYVCDASELKNEQTLHDELHTVRSFNIPYLAIANKCDLLTEREQQQLEASGQFICISAKKRNGIETLRQRLYEVVIQKEHINAGAETVTNIRHYEALLNTTSALAKAKEGLQKNLSGELIAFDLRDALQHLGSITGEVSNEEVLGSIFSRFCIGK